MIMRKFIIIFAVLIIISLMSGFVWSKYFHSDDTVYCTQDAKLCPDGSYVGREGPKCEFTECPKQLNEEADGYLFKTSGMVMGTVSIAPLCSADEQSCPESVNAYTSRRLIFTPTGGVRPVDQPFYVSINADGKFAYGLPAGNYDVNITDCTYIGCEYALPKHISVEANKALELIINIGTGVR